MSGRCAPGDASMPWRKLAEPGRPGDRNQALMEPDATVCTPRAPRCLLCPLARDCEARVHGHAESLPRRRVGSRTAAPSRMRGPAVRARSGPGALRVRACEPTGDRGPHRGAGNAPIEAASSRAARGGRQGRFLKTARSVVFPSGMLRPPDVATPAADRSFGGRRHIGVPVFRIPGARRVLRGGPDADGAYPCGEGRHHPRG